MSAVSVRSGAQAPAKSRGIIDLLYLVIRNAPGARIERLDLATGKRTPVKTLMPADRAGLIDLSFVSLSTDARSYVYSYKRVLSTLYLVDGLR